MVLVCRMRGGNDCGCAALAMLLWPRVDYEGVAANAPRGGQAGFRTRELAATARRLGVRLEATRAFDLAADVGVLRVRSPKTHREGHWVAVKYGLIWDPFDGVATPWRDYAARHRARFGTLLRLV